MSNPGPSKFRKRIAGGIFALLACLALVMFPGCLVGMKTVAALYEPQADQFRFLSVFQHIGSDKPENEPADQKWLTALYENRQNLVIAPDPMFEDWGLWAALRLPDNRWSDIQLTQLPPEGLKSRDDEIPLRDIQIKPGHFFLRGADNLCYYHEVIVPGKTADAVVSYFNRQFASPSKNAPADWLGQLIEQRRKQLAAISWDDFTRDRIEQVLASIDNGSPANQPATEPSGAAKIPFDLATLQRVHDDLLAGKLPLVRQGDKLVATVEMTEADVTGAANFADAFRSAVEDGLTQETPDEKPDDARMRAQLARLMNCATVTPTDPTHLRLSIDLIGLFNSFDDPVQTNPDVDQDQRDAGTRMAQFAAASLDLDQNLTVESIEQDFKNGTLQAYPPTQLAAPGTDMGPISPATQPAN
ncbi:MAG: hypothetical protein ABSF29_12880 [Tepidisphaeraceae bacterium]